MFLAARNRSVTDERPRLSELAEPARDAEFERWLQRQQQEEPEAGQRLPHVRTTLRETYGFD